MRVKAKFVCSNKQENTVHFHAVTTGSEENKEFWKYTPSGQIIMNIDNPAALDQFEQGAEYYVTFDKA